VAKNYNGPISPITIVAPATLTSGTPVLVGGKLCIPQTDAASGADVAVELVGDFTIASATSQAWTQFQAIYWDDTAKNCTTTVGSNTLVGTAAQPKLAAAATGRVRLNQ